MATTSPSSLTKSTATPAAPRSNQLMRPLPLMSMIDLSADGCLHEEDVALQVGGCRVAADDVGQRRVFELSQLAAGEDVLEPEAVAVAEPLELVAEDRFHERAGRSTGHMILGEGADPEVDVVDAAVEILQLLLDGRCRT